MSESVRPKLEELEMILTVPEGAGHLACLVVQEAKAYVLDWLQTLEREELQDLFR